MRLGDKVTIIEGNYKGRMGIVNKIHDGWMFQQYEVLLDGTGIYCYPYHNEFEKLEC